MIGSVYMCVAREYMRRELETCIPVFGDIQSAAFFPPIEVPSLDKTNNAGSQKEHQNNSKQTALVTAAVVADREARIRFPGREG